MHQCFQHMTRAQFYASDSDKCPLDEVEEISDVQAELLGGYSTMRFLCGRVTPGRTDGSARLCPVVSVGSGTP